MFHELVTDGSVGPWRHAPPASGLVSDELPQCLHPLLLTTGGFSRQCHETTGLLIMAVKAATRTLISDEGEWRRRASDRSIGEGPQGPVFSAASFTLRRVEGTVQDPALMASHARHPAPEGE